KYWKPPVFSNRQKRAQSRICLTSHGINGQRFWRKCLPKTLSIKCNSPPPTTCEQFSVPQPKRVSASLSRREASRHAVATPWLWQERWTHWLGQYRSLIQRGVGGIAVLALCGIIWASYWGQQRRQGLEELRTG